MTTDEFIKQASTDRLIELLLDHPDGSRTVPECTIRITRKQLILELADRHVLLTAYTK